MACEERLPRPLPSSSTPELRNSPPDKVICFAADRSDLHKTDAGLAFGRSMADGGVSESASADGPHRKSRTTCTGS